MTHEELKQKTKEIKEATGALEGVKRAIDTEHVAEDPNGYTLGTLVDAVGLLAKHITLLIIELEELAGVPEYD